MYNIDVLNDIMKPYFEKKAEIEGISSKLNDDVKDSKEKLSELRSDRLERKKALQLELEELRVRKTVVLKEFQEKKEKEILEYISEALNSNPNLSYAYGAYVKKDLERIYDKKLEELKEEFRLKEEKLVEQIKELSSKSEDEKQEAKELVNLSNRTDYTNVYLREMVELKDSLRIKLFAERRKLKSKQQELMSERKEYEKIVADLDQKQVKLKELIDSIANFKYEYNEQNQVVNIVEINELYSQRKDVLSEIEELSDALLEKKNVILELNDLNKSLEKVEEYIKMTELTKDETRAVTMSMTPLERAEYDRRKGITTLEKSEYDRTKNLVPLSNFVRTVKKEYSLDGISNNPDMIEVMDPVVSSYEIEDGKVVVDKKIDLLKAIFNDIIAEAQSVRSVRINPSKEQLGKDEYYVSTNDGSNKKYEEAGTVNLYEVDEKPMQLPNGEYVYSSDMKQAVDNYYDKNKGKTYVVKSTGKEYRVNLGTILKFKSSLKLCSAIKLIKDKKVSKMDITRIYGKQKSDVLFETNDIGTMYGKENMPEGEYINRNELIAKLNNLFTTKKLEWLRGLSNRLKGNDIEPEEERAEKSNLK